MKVICLLARGLAGAGIGSRKGDSQFELRRKGCEGSTELSFTKRLFTSACSPAPVH